MSLKVVSGLRDFRSLLLNSTQNIPVVLTIGNFDGVHLGHQRLIKKAIEAAAEVRGQVVVMTFDPHPLEVLKPDFKIAKVTSNKQQEQIFSELGVSMLIRQKFDLELAKLTAEEFLVDLKTHTSFCHLVVGYDFAFGSGRSGHIEFLTERSRTEGFQLTVQEPVRVSEEGELKGQIVSSRLIRALLADGKCELLPMCLGRNFQVNGTVIKGAQRGRILGTPTANLKIEELRALRTGVYLVKVHVEREYWGVANIGVNPTFEGKDSEIPVLKLEVHIFDFENDIYGQSIDVELVHWLRAEVKFASIEELKSQILQDIVKAKALIKS